MGHLRVDEDGAVVTVTIDRPEQHNAIDFATWRELGSILDDLALEARHYDGLRVVILRGEGGRAFSAGSDLKEFATMTIDEVRRCFLTMEQTISKVEHLPYPVIAAIGGYALGSAFELACACDLQVASERARLESVEAQIASTERDIRVLETEIGTRGRLAQLERWNANFIRLSAPSADQILEGGFQLAGMVRPPAKPARNLLSKRRTQAWPFPVTSEPWPPGPGTTFSSLVTSTMPRPGMR